MFNKHSYLLCLKKLLGQVAPEFAREVLFSSDHEPFLTFVNHLKEVAKHCEFPDLDKEVKRQISQKTCTGRVRQKALEKNLLMIRY